MTKKLLPRVYIAGPIRKGNLVDNIQQSRVAASRLMTSGYAPLNPMLSCFSQSDKPCVASGFTHDEWMAMDLSWVSVANAVLRLPGESSGADEEVEFAIEHGIPVYYSVDALVKDFK